MSGCTRDNPCVDKDWCDDMRPCKRESERDQSHADKPRLPEWLKPGIWVRNTHASYWGRAFVTGVDEKEAHFTYHLERPFQQHAAIAAWMVGGTAYTMDGWEPCGTQSAVVASVTEEGFTQQIHFMQRQSQMLAEQGDDVAARVMAEAAQMVADVWKDRERYRKGMANWKATAEAKDREFAQSASEASTDDARDAARWRKFNEVAKRHFNYDTGSIRFYLPRAGLNFQSFEETVDAYIDPKNATDATTDRKANP